jgi:hypothetical protein
MLDRTYPLVNIVVNKVMYSLRPILSFANTDISRTKMCLDTSIFAKGNMGRREYDLLPGCC